MIRASANSIKFTPILAPPQDPSSVAEMHQRPVAHLLTIDNYTILLDAGWTSEFDVSVLEKLNQVMDKVDCVVISSPDMAHCGAAPFLKKRLRPGVHVFATFPTSRLGLYNVSTEFNNKFPNEHTFSNFYFSQMNASNGEEELVPLKLSIDDVYGAFMEMKEPAGGKVTLQPRPGGESISLEPMQAGRLLGGCAWRIVYQTDDIMYFPDFSLKQSALLRSFDVSATANILLASAASLQPEIPASCKNQRGAVLSPSDVEDKLLTRIKASVRRNNNVLLPVDACGRGIELVLTLSTAFKREGLKGYNLVFAFSKSGEVLDRTKTMTDHVKDSLFVEGNDAFEPERVICVRNKEELEGVADPKVIVAHGTTLETGLVAELIQDFVQNPEAAIIFTGDAPAPNTLGAALYNEVLHEVEPVQPRLRSAVQCTLRKRFRLEGAELDTFRAEKEEQSRQQAEKSRQEMIQRLVATEEGDAMASDSDDEMAAGDDDTAPNAEEEDAANQPGAFRKNMAVANLFLPPDMEAALKAELGKKKPNPLAKKRILFPIVASAVAPPKKVDDTTRNVGEDDEVDQAAIYGLPLAGWEVDVFQRNAPDRVFDDSAIELRVKNDVRANDQHPAKIVEEQFNLRPHELKCFVGILDMASRPTIESLKNLLNTHFLSARSVVLHGGLAADMRLLVNFCQGSSLKCSDSVHVARAHSSTELAKEVFAYDVRLDPQLAAITEHQMHRIDETRGTGQWEVGFIRGELEVHGGNAGGGGGGGPAPSDDLVTSPRNPNKRIRKEGGGEAHEHHPDGHLATNDRADEEVFDQLFVMKPVNKDRQNDAAKELEEAQIVTGSTFIGRVELPKLRDLVRNDLKLQADFNGATPLLTVEKGHAYIRRVDSGDVTIEGVASLEQFNVRKKVYDAFSHTI